MQLQKINKENLYVVGDTDQMTVRFFKSKADYIDWKNYTKENGHDMISFYKIKKMMSQYHNWTKEEFDLIY